LQLIGFDNSAARVFYPGIPGIRYLDQGSRDYSKIGPFIEQHGGSAKALEYAQKRLAEDTKKYGEGSADARDWLKTIHEIKNPPTSNYVVFDDKLIDILKKYGMGGILGAGGASQMQGEQ
jgi:hypothetical protein